MYKFIIAVALIFAVLIGLVIITKAIGSRDGQHRSFFESLAYTFGDWKKIGNVPSGAAKFSPTPYDAQNPRMQQDFIYRPPSEGGSFPSGVSSYGRAAHPMVFGESQYAATYSTSGEPDMSTFGRLQEQAFREDLNAQSGTKLFKDRPLPREPITDSVYHYVGDYSEALYDPLQDSIFRKQDNLGYAGVSIFHQH